MSDRVAMAPAVGEGGSLSCPACGEPLSGPGGRLRVVATEEVAYDVVEAEEAPGGGFRVRATTDSPTYIGEAAPPVTLCAACIQELNMPVHWDETH